RQRTAERSSTRAVQSTPCVVRTNRKGDSRSGIDCNLFDRATIPLTFVRRTPLPEEQSVVRIDYSDIGQGEPALLLMPSWCATRKVFGPKTELCAKHRRVLALDWRGMGSSGTSNSDFGQSDLVEDALAVIGASGAQNVVPVALSHSGWIAIELRRQLGLRIRRWFSLTGWCSILLRRFLRACLGCKIGCTGKRHEAGFSPHGCRA